MQPKLFECLKTYNYQTFTKDLIAGIIVAIIALPLSIAFGISNGATPQQGLITAIIAGFIISAFGGSKWQIGGPTGAFMVIVYGTIEKFGMSGLATATVLAGLLLLLMGIFKMGAMVKFVSKSIVVGFTAGIAISIFSTQVPDILGITTAEKIPTDFLHKWIFYFQNITNINFYACFLSILTILMIFLIGKKYKKLPATFIALIFTTIISILFKFPVETIGSRFGAIKFEIPKLVVPSFSWEVIQPMIGTIIVIALLGAVESLLSAIVADSMTKEKHDSNMELVGQGLANIITPLFGGIPATGAVSRTAANINNGGKTPVAGMIHAIVLLLMLIFCSTLITYIPMATLGGILFVVSYNMFGFKTLKKMSKAPIEDLIVLYVTLLLTVFSNLVTAIEVGVLLSIVFFVNRVSKNSYIKTTDAEHIEGFCIVKTMPEKTVIFELKGVLFFADSDAVLTELHKLTKKYKNIVLRMNDILVLDASGLDTLENFIKVILENKKINLYLLQLSPNIKKDMEKYGIIDLVGENKIFNTVEDVMAEIEK